MVMSPEASNAVMAVAFFGAIAITARSITSVWIRRLDFRRQDTPTGELGDRLGRIESAVDAISIEVERISEAQRFSARLQAEAGGGRLPTPDRASQGRVITPH